MRRGELTGLRRNRIVWDELRLTVDTANEVTSSNLDNRQSQRVTNVFDEVSVVIGMR